MVHRPLYVPLGVVRHGKVRNRRQHPDNVHQHKSPNNRLSSHLPSITPYHPPPSYRSVSNRLRMHLATKSDLVRPPRPCQHTYAQEYVRHTARISSVISEVRKGSRSLSRRWEVSAVSPHTRKRRHPYFPTRLAPASPERGTPGSTPPTASPSWSGAPHVRSASDPSAHEAPLSPVPRA